MVRKLQARSIAFFVLAAIGLITAWVFNGLAVMTNQDYLKAWFGTAVDLVLSIDLLIVAVAVAIFMIYEGKRLGMKRVWLYIALSSITAMAFTFPLFLAMRDRKLIERRLAGGKLERFDFDGHTVDVWVPKDLNPKTPLLVMHDGRNIFDEQDSFTGKTWEVLTALRDEVRSPSPIVVAVWGQSDETRIRELSPEKIVREDIEFFWRHLPDSYRATGTEPFGDSYVSLLADAIVPFVLDRYGVKHSVERTAVMGASMGGLISMYAMGQRPEVFGTAICFSSHWVFGEDRMVKGLVDQLPTPGTHRVWTDSGTIELDQYYPPFHKLAEQKLLEKGYVPGDQLVTSIYPNTGHHESYWARRVAEALNWWLRSDPRT